LRLAEEVLALHDGIREVFILEERGGRFLVTDEAARGDTKMLSSKIDLVGLNAPLAPAVILGAATQFGGEPAPPSVIGILYNKGGIVFSQLEENRLLAVSTSPAGLYNVMETLNGALPGLIGEHAFGAKAESVVKSAADAENIARYYVAGRTGGSAHIVVDGVSYQGANRRWEVKGAYRAIGGIRSKHFQLEVDGDDGSVMKFASSNSSGLPVTLIVELVSLVAAIGLLGWWIYYTILR
jgi:hypothetical protein